MIRGKLTLYLSIVDGTEPQKRSVQDAIATINTKKENILFVGFSDAFQNEIRGELPPLYQDKFFLLYSFQLLHKDQAPCTQKCLPGPNYSKALIIMRAGVKNQLNLI